MPTTDATFRYRNFEWQTSGGGRHHYEYLVVQQPAGGATANRDALSALEAPLPAPPSGWSILLIPSVSLVCGGKEEMRPLASGLAQRGHRCFVAEWPGWTVDAQANWQLALCKPEELAAEYHDFWCQLLEHIARTEEAEVGRDEEQAAEAQDEDVAKPAASRRLCVVGAGHSAVYATRALRELLSWRREEPRAESFRADAFAGLVLLAPTWKTVRAGLLARLAAPRASRWLGSWLHADTRLGRWARSRHFSRRHFRKHFALRGREHSEAVAQWLFQRPRPYTSTDGPVLHGLLDPLPSGLDATTLTTSVADCLGSLEQGAMLLVPEGADGKPADADVTVQVAPTMVTRADLPSVAALRSALAKWESALDGRGRDASLLPHEAAPTGVLWALDQWLAQAGRTGP